MSNIVLGSSLTSTLTAIQRTSRNFDQTSERLATGLRVNSAIDQPKNFFTASALRTTANQYNNLLDTMNLGLRTIQEAVAGLEAIEEILELAEIKALEAKTELESSTLGLPEAILADSPVGYFRLNDADTTTALNLGTLGAGGEGTYTNGVIQSEEILFYGAGGLAAKFDGVNQYVAIPNDDSINTNGPFPERTVELIFNADAVGGRQVLWEEGGTVNSLNIYIDNGLLRVNGRTTANGGYGPLDISIPIEAGVTYHVAFTQDGPNSRFTGYLNGEVFGSADIGGAFIGNHPNFNGIGAVNNNVYFHDDGPGNAPGRGDGTFAFQGLISDVAIYNSIISSESIQERYAATSLPVSEEARVDVVEFMDQIQAIIEDASFRGVNLLNKEDLLVDLNDDLDHTLEIAGGDFSLEALGLDKIFFQKPSQTEESITNIRRASDAIREYVTSLQNDFYIISTRQDFTRLTVNTLESGADDLVVADLNEESAKQLANQVRLDIATSTLSVAAQSQSSILTVIGSGSDLFGG